MKMKENADMENECKTERKKDNKMKEKEMFFFLCI